MLSQHPLRQKQVLLSVVAFAEERASAFDFPICRFSVAMEPDPFEIMEILIPHDVWEVIGVDPSDVIMAFAVFRQSGRGDFLPPPFQSLAHKLILQPFLHLAPVLRGVLLGPEAIIPIGREFLPFLPHYALIPISASARDPDEEWEKRAHEHMLREKAVAEFVGAYLIPIRGAVIVPAQSHGAEFKTSPVTAYLDDVGAAVPMWLPLQEDDAESRYQKAGDRHQSAPCELDEPI